MTDLTKNTTPYSLLSEEDKEGLKKAKQEGKQILYYSYVEKRFVPLRALVNTFYSVTVYRVEASPKIRYIVSLPNRESLFSDPEMAKLWLRECGLRGQEYKITKFVESEE